MLNLQQKTNVGNYLFESHKTAIMRPISPIVIVIFFLTLLGSRPPQEPDVVVKISGTLKTGQTHKLAGHFNITLDWVIPGSEGTYSTKQAEQLIKVFFTKNPVKDFTLDHDGKSNDGSRYMIGTLKSRNKKSFRVYILIKTGQIAEAIHQLQIEEE